MTTDVITVIEREKIDAINREHRLCEQAWSGAVVHARECGRMLAAVKADVGHGNFGPWLKDHFLGSDRTARVYMQLAEAPELENGSDSADLPTSISAALREISKPAARVTPRDAVGMLGGLEDDDEPRAAPSPSTDIARAEPAWTDRHTRRRSKIVELLVDAGAQLERASDPGLSAHAINELLRSAEIKMRQAQAQTGELAFSFE